MPLDLGTIVLILLGASFLALAYRHARNTGERMHMLEYFPRVNRILDSIRGVPVRIETSKLRSEGYVEVGGEPYDLGFEAKPSAGEGGTVGGPHMRVLLGDPEFDARVVIDGDELQAVAALDTESREGVLRLVQKNGRIERGKIVVGLTEQELDGRVVGRHVSGFVTLVKRFAACEPTKLRTRLTANALNDPVSGVRARNLELIAKHFPDAKSTRRALDKALHEQSADVRFVAAAELGQEPVLQELTGSEHATELRAKAIRALGVRGDIEKTRPTFIALLRDSEQEVRRAAAKVLVANGWNAEGGGLTLAEAESGALSLAEEAGSVSLVTREKGIVKATD
jgi:hypothetical protein